MKRSQVFIPLPRSAFLLVRCPKCGAERVIYSHAAMPVKCPQCGEVMAEPTGGRAAISGEIVRRLD